MSKTGAFSIVADVGGTNTRVALARDGRVDASSIQRFRNTEFAGLEAVLHHYRDQRADIDCASVCVAVAGPVRDGAARLTNLDWSITDASLIAATGATRTAILNDLQAQGYALGHLAEGTLRPILPTQTPAPAQAAQLVIGVGTGFNAAPVHETAHGRIVIASECGHTRLPVLTQDDFRLLHHLESQHGYVCVEDVLSGRGLEQVHAWVRSEMGDGPAQGAAQIMAAILKGDDPVALASAAHFMRLLGVVVGDLALTHLPFGGIYLIGGVARAFAPLLPDGPFAQAFRAKGRFADFMQSFPIYVVEDDYAALTGCALFLQALG